VRVRARVRARVRVRVRVRVRARIGQGSRLVKRWVGNHQGLRLCGPWGSSRSSQITPFLPIFSRSEAG